MDRKPTLSFNNEIFWKQNKLGSLIKKIETGTNELGKEIKTNFPLIKMGNIQLGTFNLSKLEYLTEKQFESSKKYIAKNGDFLFNTRNTLALVGKAATWATENKDFVFNSNIARISFDDSKISSHFLNYLYATPSVWSQVKARAVGTTSVAAVYPRDLSSIKLFIPNIKEQEKISTFFRQLDLKIHLQQKKIYLLKEQKKGYMQRIFYGEDSLPKKAYRLDQLGIFYKGHTLSKQDLTAEGLSCVLYGQLYTEYNEVINSVKHKTSNTNGFKGLKGDLLIPSSGETAIDIARVSSLQENALLGGDLSVLRVNPNIADSNYLSYQINFKYKRDLAKLAQGASVVHLYTSDIKKLVIQLPTLEHQYKVSSLLSIIDRKIQLEDTKRLALLTHKKALMQQMFI